VTGRPGPLVRGPAIALLLLAGACSTPAPTPPPQRAEAPRATTTIPTTTSTPSTAPPAPAAARPARPPAPAGTGAAPAVLTVAYRVERRVGDQATAGFEAMVEATLSDPRGWSRAGFRLVRDAGAPHLIVLAEGEEVDALCLPYRTYGLYSCQNGPVVALNADRWRTATPKWTGDPETYRRMLVNHEVGHLLGQEHPAVQCPTPGRPAPVMAQQSTELDGCLPNAWPLAGEIERAARHDRPIAPPFERKK
jgi:hypothetical protein